MGFPGVARIWRDNASIGALKYSKIFGVYGFCVTDT